MDSYFFDAACSNVCGGKCALIVSSTNAMNPMLNRGKSQRTVGAVAHVPVPSVKALEKGMFAWVVRDQKAVANPATHTSVAHHTCQKQGTCPCKQCKGNNHEIVLQYTAFMSKQ